MLKKIAFYLTGISLALACACTREMPHEKTDKEQKPVESTAEWVKGNEAKGGAIIGIRTRIGHKADVCDGSCSNDNKHMDCQGNGYECSLVSNLEMKPIFSKSSTQTLIYIGQCLYPEDISDCETFSMPARSFLIEKEQHWLNIPMQIIHRNPQNRCFIIKNITFTSQALYPNS